MRTGNTGRQGYVSEREWDGSDTGWKLPVFTETPEYGKVSGNGVCRKDDRGQTFDSSYAFRKNGAQKEIRFQKSLSRWWGIRAECKDTGSDSWKICELVRDDTRAFPVQRNHKIRIPDEMGESGADRIRFVFFGRRIRCSTGTLRDPSLNPVELCQMEQIGERILGRGQDSQIRDSRWRALGQFRPQWNWKQNLLSIREYLNPGDVSVIFPDQSRKTDILWSTERVEISALEMNPRIAAGRNHPSDTRLSRDRGVGGNVKRSDPIRGGQRKKDPSV